MGFDSDSGSNDNVDYSLAGMLSPAFEAAFVAAFPCALSRLLVVRTQAALRDPTYCDFRVYHSRCRGQSALYWRPSSGARITPAGLSMTPPLPLAAAFPVFTESDWRAAATKMQRDAVRTPNDSVAGGAVAGPLFQRRIGALPIAGRPALQPWRVVQRVDAEDAASAVRSIGTDAAGGTGGVEIAFAGSLHPMGGQLPEDEAPALAKALAPILRDNFQLRIDDAGSVKVAQAFFDIAAARKAELVLAFDPIAAVAIRGAAVDEIGARLRATANAFDARQIDGAVVTTNGVLWHAGGATEEQEIAAALASFVACLRLLDTPGKIRVTLAADTDQFRTIAKFRAMRLLLARVAEVAELTSPAPQIHAETAWRSMSARDPEMNILRTTSAAFAAAVGGADSITVLPFDVVTGGTDSHTRRLARNTQTILAEEAHLFRVADPSAGSGAIEALTEAYAEEAWRQFQAIEKEGGMLAAIKSGRLLGDIAKARQDRLARVASGDVTMVGVNAYADDNAMPKIVVAAKERALLIFMRLSEAFEVAQ